MADEQKQDRLIRVRAIIPDKNKHAGPYVGYSGLVRRRAGEVFDIPESHFSKTWMEKVGDATPKSPAPGEATPEELGVVARASVVSEPRTLSEVTRRGRGRAVVT